MATEPRLVLAADGLEVIDNPGEGRYEAWLEGEPAGLIAYIANDGWLIFDHTEVFEAYEGKGVASRLAKAALDDLQVRDLRVNPMCPFVSGYIQKHPEYRPLVVGARGPRPSQGGRVAPQDRI
jgi:predicted GNAT family acetyltransferase